ncbi:MAG: GNAT family N-acetyltransferase [Thermoanaerobaculia bacterium]
MDGETRARTGGDGPRPPEPVSPGEIPGGYRLERTNARNIHLLLPLFREVSGRDVTVDYLLRKYTTPWTKDGWFHGYMALDRAGRVVAHQTGVPFRFRFGDRLVLGAQSCDTMTAAELRGKGIFTILGAKVDQLLAEEGFAFVFGFTNENSLAAFTKKLGYRYLDTMKGYRLRVRTLPLERICRRLRFPYRAYLSLVDRAFRSLRIGEPVPSSCIGPGTAGVVRDEAFYDYRGFSFNRRVRLAGVPLWFKLEAALCIGEIGEATEESFLGMIAALRRRCFWLGIDEVLFQASPGTRNEVLFARHFPAFDSWVALYKDLSGSVDVGTLKATFGDLDSF